MLFNGSRISGPRILRIFLLVAVVQTFSLSAIADSRNRAPGFESLQKGINVLIMAPDVELFSISAGGVLEPKADWTEIAHKNIRKALNERMSDLKLHTKALSEDDADSFAQINALHGAVARSIALHHMGGGSFQLPTKNGQLDWSLGSAVQPIREKLGSDYALFVWMRDSYASAERKVAMVALALLGVGIPGGAQIGYASLVDLRTGRVMWFNRLLRGKGDLREAEPAAETIQALLADFPVSK